MINWIVVASIIIIVIIVVLALVNNRSINSKIVAANYLEERTLQKHQLYKIQYDYNYQLKEVKHDLQKYYEHYDIPDEKIFNYSDSSAINRIISCSDEKCDSLGIDFIKAIDKTAIPNIDELALVGILGNLLENAIEASSSYGKKISMAVREINEGNRFDNVFKDNCGQSRQKNSIVEIIIWNSKNPDINISSNLAETTKEDKDMHGFGSGIVDKLLENNNGTITRTDKGETYECIVRFV